MSPDMPILAEGLNRLRAEIARDLAWLNHPPANWPLPRTGPDGAPALDVLVVGGGMLPDRRLRPDPRRRADPARGGPGAARRPELDAFRPGMQLWRERVSAAEAGRYRALARDPYLGPGFELQARDPALAADFARLRLFNQGAAVSHGMLVGDIPGLAIGVQRLAQSIGQALFTEDLDGHRQAVIEFEEPELRPTPYYYVPPARRRRRSGEP
jgi:hypothetical protein